MSLSFGRPERQPIVTCDKLSSLNLWEIKRGCVHHPGFKIINWQTVCNDCCLGTWSCSASSVCEVNVKCVGVEWVLGTFCEMLHLFVNLYWKNLTRGSTKTSERRALTILRCAYGWTFLISLPSIRPESFLICSLIEETWRDVLNYSCFWKVKEKKALLHHDRWFLAFSGFLVVAVVQP